MFENQHKYNLVLNQPLYQLLYKILCNHILLRNSGLYRIVRYRYIGVNQTFHEQHNIHHTRSNENDNIGKSPDYG